MANNSEDNKNKLDYLFNTHGEVRSEIQSRINQRDTFAIQFIVGSGAIITIGFLEFQYSPYLFFLLPIIALFYSIQILYSYTIHDRCHKFLANNIEPEIAKTLAITKGDEERLMWEEYCDVEAKKIKVKTPGIRKRFFEIAVFVVPVIASCLFYLLASYRKLHDWWIILIISVSIGLIFELISFLVIRKFNKASK